MRNMIVIDTKQEPCTDPAEEGLKDDNKINQYDEITPVQSLVLTLSIVTNAPRALLQAPSR